jgi:hypothetical protein
MWGTVDGILVRNAPHRAAPRRPDPTINLSYSYGQRSLHIVVAGKKPKCLSQWFQLLYLVLMGPFFDIQTKPFGKNGPKRPW